MQHQPSTEQTTFSEACSVAGGRARVARLARRNRSRIDQLARGEGVVPPELCSLLERETRGAYRCEQIESAHRWVRVPDPAWPWHPNGRPALDAVPTEALQLEATTSC